MCAEQWVFVHLCTTRLRIDCLCVGIVGGEVEGHGAKDAKLRGHLLHPPQPSLLLCVCKLHHQTGRRSLWGERWRFTWFMCVVMRCLLYVLMGLGSVFINSFTFSVHLILLRVTWGSSPSQHQDNAQHRTKTNWIKCAEWELTRLACVCVCCIK